MKPKLRTGLRPRQSLASLALLKKGGAHQRRDKRATRARQKAQHQRRCHED